MNETRVNADNILPFGYLLKASSDSKVTVTLSRPHIITDFAVHPNGAENGFLNTSQIYRYCLSISFAQSVKTLRVPIYVSPENIVHVHPLMSLFQICSSECLSS